jgi:hypothetical protein
LVPEVTSEADTEIADTIITAAELSGNNKALTYIWIV